MQHSKIESLSNILKEADKLVDKIPKVSNHEDFLYYLYFLSLYDISENIYFLIKHNKLRNTPILVRTFLETYIDLKTLLKEPSYINNYIIKDLNFELNKLNTISSPSNPIENQEIKSRVLMLKNEINERKLTALPLALDYKEKFNNLDLLLLYQTTYNELCSFSHNSISQIEKRFLTPINNSSVILNHLAKPKIKDYEEYLDLVETRLKEVINIISQKINL